MIKAIGFAGVAGVGKTTTARQLCGDWKRFKFLTVSSPIKHMLRTFYAQTTDLNSAEIAMRLDGPHKELSCMFLGGKSPRQAMQSLGTEWGRDRVYHGLWVEAWKRNASSLIGLGNIPVNDAVRFQNEVDAIRDLGGAVVRLTGRDTTTDQVEHSSEQPDKLEGVVDLEITGDPEKVAVDTLIALYGKQYKKVVSRA